MLDMMRAHTHRRKRAKGRVYDVRFGKSGEKKTYQIAIGGTKAAAELACWRIHRLKECCDHGIAIPDEIADWVFNKLEPSHRAGLIEAGALDRDRYYAAEPVERQLREWRQWIIDSGRTVKHADQQHRRAARVVEAIDARVPRDIDAVRVSHVVSAMNYAQSTKNQHIGAIRQFVKWMMDHGRTRTIPDGWGLLKKQKVTELKVARRSYTEDEIDRMCDVDDPNRRLLYLVAIFTGLRAGELREVQAGDIVLEHRVLFVRASTTKSRKDAEVPLADILIEPLASWIGQMEPHDHVFNVPARAAERLRKDLGINDKNHPDRPGADFHALRHTFCSLHARNGTPPAVLSKLARHSTIQLTNKWYTHLMPSDQLDAVNAVANRVKGNKEGNDARRTA